MIENVVEITPEQLLSEAHKMRYSGYRFVTITCVDLKDGNLDLIYHFDKDLELLNYRLKISKESELMSISKVYFGALLVENEIKELFGVNITNIVIDYGGKMLLSDDAQTTPMLCNQIEIVQRGEE